MLSGGSKKMVQQSNSYNLSDSWRALSGNTSEEGWRTIPIEITGNCELMAARYFPDDMEAILIGFRNIVIPLAKNLPQGQGFQVGRIESNSVPDRRIWVSLLRLPAGSIEMFERMAEDIVRTVHSHSSVSEEHIFQIFSNRIKAWQDFMDKGSGNVLSAEAETGLFGELTILDEFLFNGIPLNISIQSWVGPADGIHDFVFGSVGIEVKTTVSKGEFIARIGSLEQLDSSLVHSLFLAGVRLLNSDIGLTLPEKIYNIRKHFDDNPIAQNIFDCRLIQAGYMDFFSERYTRRFRNLNNIWYQVDNAFPKLTKENIPQGIVRAKYDLDLNLVPSQHLCFDDVLLNLRGS
jgi:hypothetical protein